MRLFYGISLPDEIRLATKKRMQDAMPFIPARYTLPFNHHITLAFIGDVPQARIQTVQSILADTLSRTTAPLLTLGETGYFGRPQNAVLIIRVKSDPSLSSLHAALIHALKAANLPADPGPFSAHITLGRHAQLEGVPLPSGPALSFRPSHGYLFLSARNEENILTYTPIFSAPFAISAL